MAKRNSTTKTVAVEHFPMGKVVRYNRETMDYDAFFDGQYLGSRATEHAARECVNEYVYDLERSGMMYTATELDHGSSVEEIAADIESAPISPSASAITVQPFICTDTLSPNYGQPIGTSYLLNGVEVYVPDNPAQPVQLELPTTTGGRPDMTSFRITPSALDHEPYLAPDALAAIPVLLNAPRIQAALTRHGAGAPPAPMPAAPAVTANTWQGEAGTTYADFSAGDGLTKALIGTHGGTKDGIELIIGGACINERSDEVLTLDDVRQLRDNLTALLNDPRLLATLEEPHPPTPAAPVAQAARGTLALDLTDINRAIGYTAARLSQTLDCLTPARRDALMRLITKLDTASAPERDDLVDTLLRSASAWHYAPQPPTPAAPVFPIPTVPAKTKNGSWQAQIGELDGLPVTGFYAGRELMHATVVYQGVPVGIYAADSGEYVNAGIGEGLGFGGDMHFSEWRALAALGRTDIVDRLLILFRQYATTQGGTDCEECGARLLPDDEDQLCVRCHGARWRPLRAVLRAA